MGLFSSPNRAGIMNALPARMRGVGSGMAATFQNSAMVLSIGIFFSLIILGLASTLSGALLHGLTGAGVRRADASRAASLPPVATLFASLLGYNPIQQLLGPATGSLSPDQLHYVTGRSFFPDLIAEPFHNGLRIAFLFAIIACLVAAAASYLRGGKYHYVEGRGARVERGPGDRRCDGRGHRRRRGRRRPDARATRWSSRHSSSRSSDATARPRAGTAARRPASTVRPPPERPAEPVRTSQPVRTAEPVLRGAVRTSRAPVTGRGGDADRARRRADRPDRDRRGRPLRADGSPAGYLRA